MKCKVHPERDAVAVCMRCGSGVCSECLVSTRGKNYCKNCINEILIQKPIISRENITDIVNKIEQFSLPNDLNRYKNEMKKYTENRAFPNILWILEASLNLIAKGFGQFILISLVIFLSALFTLLFPFMILWDVLLLLWLFPGIVSVTLGVYEDKPFLESVKRGWSNIISSIWVTILAMFFPFLEALFYFILAIIVFLLNYFFFKSILFSITGIVLIIISGIIYFYRLMKYQFSLNVLISEGIKGTQALKRSSQLASGFLLTLLLRNLVLYLIGVCLWIVSFLFSLLPQCVFSRTFSTTLNIVNTAIFPIWIFVYTIIEYEVLKLIKEEKQFCGLQDNTRVSLPQNSKTMATANKVLKCPSCGAEISSSDNFCLECGKPLNKNQISLTNATSTNTNTIQSFSQKRVYRCPKCKTIIEVGQLKCPGCGVKLKWIINK